MGFPRGMSRQRRREPALVRPRVDRRARDAAVAQRLLDEQEVAGPTVEPDCEPVPQRVDGRAARHGSAIEPQSDAPLDVADGNPLPPAPGEQRAGRAVTDVIEEVRAEVLGEHYRLPAVALRGAEVRFAAGKIQILDVEGNCRSDPHAGLGQQANDRQIASGHGIGGRGQGGDESLEIVIGHGSHRWGSRAGAA